MNVLRDFMGGLGYSRYECTLRNLVSLIEILDRIDYSSQIYEEFAEEIQGTRTFTSLCLQDLKRYREEGKELLMYLSPIKD